MVYTKLLLGQGQTSDNTHTCFGYINWSLNTRLDSLAQT